MPDPKTPKSGKATIIVMIGLTLAFVVINCWPHPRGIYDTDYGWPMTLATIGKASNFDVLAAIVDLVVALDVLILVGAMLSPSIRKLALFWIPVVLLQLIIAGLIKLMFLFVLRS